MRPTRTLLAAVAVWMLAPRPALAADTSFTVNAEGGAAHLVGDDKSGQFGWGAAGLVAPELRLGKVVGIELPVGVIGLTRAAHQDPAYLPSASGAAIVALPGLRLRPFAASWGDPIWLAGGAGLADTGGLARPAVDVRAGVDVHAGRFDVGPFAGLIQVVDTASGVRSEDARVVLFGLHVAATPFKRRAPTPDLTAPDAVEPVADRDHDGIPDAVDKCPDEGGEFVIRDPKSAYYGCPDRDGDGIPDSIDKCPDEPEDFDGFQDADGCPDPDNDNDGIPDVVDQCPNEPETFNGFEDADGCPDEVSVRVAGDHIQLDDRVLFAIDQSKILLATYGMLGNVAKLINAHPEYERILITGHADDTGDGEYNMKLSEARAYAVRAFLINAGVANARLNVEFFGMTRPRVAGRSLEARRQNRRVEFEITQRAVAKTPPPAPAPHVEKTAQAPAIAGGVR